MTERVRLLAGSVGPERQPARPDPDDADWFLPLHLRDETAARERIAAQVTAGADVVVAPTWLTHRRALLPLGETRRAAAWTAAAVRVARDGLEVGLERRTESLAEVPPEDARHGRPTPLLAATLPRLDDDRSLETGRLLPSEAATQRDYRDQAGYLADAEPDLLLVEGQTDAASARTAATEALQTGLPVWVALSRASLQPGGAAPWLDWASEASVRQLLLPPPLTAHETLVGHTAGWGGYGLQPDAIGSWIDQGASVIGRLDLAGAGALQATREAIDAHEQAAIDAQRTEDARWLELLERAARVAPGGRAVWIGAEQATPLPVGFDWLVVTSAEAHRLPAGHFRLAVADPGVDAAACLERGGILVARGELARTPDTLRVLERQGALAVYRREG
jgi:hypothetical protein